MRFTYEGLRRSLEIAARSAVQQAGIAVEQIVGARLVRLQTLPVVGAVLLGMEQARWPVSPENRAELRRTAVKRGT